MPHFKSFNFHQSRSKIKLILQQHTKFSSPGGRVNFYATRVHPDATFLKELVYENKPKIKLFLQKY